MRDVDFSADRQRPSAAGSAEAGPETGVALPPLLLSPPWLHRGKAARPKVITGLVCTAEPRADWQAGEQAAFAELPRDFEALRTPAEELGSWPERAARLGDIDAY